VLSDDTTDFREARFVDVVMLVIAGGRERTLAQYESLLCGAGFSLKGALRLEHGFSILEALPT